MDSVIHENTTTGTSGKITIPTHKARKIGEIIWDAYFSSKNILNGINKKAKNSKETGKFKDLYSLLYKEDLIFQAIINIKGNKGANTPGVDNRTLDAINRTDIQEIITKLKNKIFQFKPVKRIMIEKPGKKEKRPLGIPKLTDRIVQEIIRIILEAIYEPVFELQHEDTNYGFRSGKSAIQAIQKLQRKAQNTEWCIEGDIKGAYDNVQHNKLMEILKEKIDDRHFLDLIAQGLKCGSIHNGNYEHSILGTPQGGIVSPLLFNIYMSKLDEFVLRDVTETINEWNRTEDRKAKPVTRSYRKYESIIKSSKMVMNRIREAQLSKGNVVFKTWNKEAQEKYIEFKNKRRTARNNSSSVPYLDKKKAILRLCYVRYADDWVLFLNCSKERAIEIRDRIGRFLAEELGLTLSPEKTLITNAKKERVKFLGFTISYYSENRRRLSIRKSTSNLFGVFINRKGWTLTTNYLMSLQAESHKRRTTGNQLLIGIDQDRLETRLNQKRYINKTATRGTRKTEWTTLSDYEIVMRFNYVIRGLINYYSRPVRDFAILNKYVYLLNYSCAHTLANKHRSSLKKVFAKYGNPIRATQKQYKAKELAKEKEIQLLNYQESKKIFDGLKTEKEKEQEKQLQDEDFLHVKINWRTVYKLNKHCVICGSTNRVQMHHIKHVRKMAQTLKGFAQVIAMLNRKQILVCHECHRRIHNGTYDGISLSDFYDPDLATL